MPHISLFAAPAFHHLAQVTARFAYQSGERRRNYICW